MASLIKIKSLQAKLLLARELATQYSTYPNYEDIYNMDLEKINLWRKDSIVCHLLSLASNCDNVPPSSSKLPAPSPVFGNSAPCLISKPKAPALPEQLSRPTVGTFWFQMLRLSQQARAILVAICLLLLLLRFRSVNSVLINLNQGSGPLTTDQTTYCTDSRTKLLPPLVMKYHDELASIGSLNVGLATLLKALEEVD